MGSLPSGQCVVQLQKPIPKLLLASHIGLPVKLKVRPGDFHAGGGLRSALWNNACEQ